MRERDTEEDQVTAMSVSWLYSSGLFLIFHCKPPQDYSCYCFLIVIDIGKFLYTLPVCAIQLQSRNNGTV